MLDAIKDLLGSSLVNDDIKKQIDEQWESKLKEVHDSVSAELREEFAQRYEHDKSVMVEALDKMITENLAGEINEFVADRKVMAERQDVLQKFVVEQLTKEIKDLHSDKKTVAENFEKLENFVIDQLAKEIQEFNADKKDVVETKVALVAEARAKMEEMKKRFAEKAAPMVKTAVEKTLNKEIGQLRDDITSAREVNFGRRIFEAFANEFQTSYLMEKSEIAKLKKQIAQKDTELTEAQDKIAETTTLVESKDAEIRIAQDKVNRGQIVSELLSPLAGDKKKLMSELLESVKTANLDKAFQKYLPAVMENKAVIKGKIINEEKAEVTGNKSNHTFNQEDDNEIVDIRRLAGL